MKENARTGQGRRKAPTAHSPLPSNVPDPDGAAPLAAIVTETRYNAIGKEAATLGTIDYDFDPSGNLVKILTSTPDGAWITYTHDELHRLTSVDAHRGSPTTYTYNPNGSLETVTYGNGR